MAKPSRVRFGGPNEEAGDLSDLRVAVENYCRDRCTEHFGEVPDFGSLSVDTIRQDEAYRTAQAQLLRAKQPFEDILRTTQEIKNLGAQKLVSVEAVEAAAVIGRKAANFLSTFEIQPTRPFWLRFRLARFFDIQSIPPDVLTAMSFLSGWWPQNIDERFVRDKGASPAGVVRLESKNVKAALIASAKQHEDIVQSPEFQLIASALGIGTHAT
jgi:hypothetical protein